MNEAAIFNHYEPSGLENVIYNVWRGRGRKIMSLKRIIEASERRGKLKESLEQKGFLRIIEAHSGISGIIANEAQVTLKDGTAREFDGIWESSLTDSASKGYPDVELVGFDSRLATIQEILFVTDKPMIVDGDTGGDATQFEYMCSKLERLGVSAVIIEDKVFPKRNSLEDGVKQDLEDPDIFSTKIRRGKQVLYSNEFMIIARLESLIANKGIQDALHRAEKYLKAGSDGIMIHSKQSTPDELFEFARKYDELCQRIGIRKPLVCVPTTYNHITEEELRAKGFNIVIHANHMLRASYEAMEKVSRSILEHSRTLEANPFCASVQKIFDSVGFLDVKSKDQQYSQNRMKAIILAAGTPSEQFIKEFGEIPPCLIELKGKTILQRQVETLNNLGISEINVISGYHSHLINYANCKKIVNKDFADKYILYSLFQAETEMKDGFILVYSDILFNESLIRELLYKKRDIVLVVDNSYSQYKKRIEKTSIELVITKINTGKSHRVLNPQENEVKMIGSKISKDLATHEFIGVAYFSPKGAEILNEVYGDSKNKYKNCMYQEAMNIDRAALTDILQEIIDRGYNVNILEINKGWVEIQSKEDYNTAVEMIF